MNVDAARNGAFIIAIDPEAFAGGETRRAAMERYLGARCSWRGSDVLMASPGDREWAEAAQRQVRGIPVDPETRAALVRLAGEYSVPEP